MLSDVMVWIAAGFGAVIVAVVARILAEDAKTFIPRISEALLRRAAKRLAPPHDDLRLEEWLSHLEDTPELTGKLHHALTMYLGGAKAVAREVGQNPRWSGNWSAQFRLLDLVLVLTYGPLLAAFVVILAVLVKIESPGPALYSQMRIGRGGKPFRMWKIRTMVLDSDRLLREHLEDNPRALEEWLAKGWLAHDPRVTKVGRYLRKMSIDEVPQFWSVFKGDMTMVGPRPRFAHDIRLDEDPHYVDVRPGLTGFWQVGDGPSENSGRYLSGFGLRAYFGILLLTVSVVIEEGPPRWWKRVLLRFLR